MNPMDKVPELQARLMQALTHLTADDFGYHETDLYVVALPEVREWLKAHYEYWENVTTFTGNPESHWNGAGKRCFDIPFAGYWPKASPQPSSSAA